MLRSTDGACRESTKVSTDSDGMVIGRGFAGILDSKMSREHVRLVPRCNGFEVHPRGSNGVEVIARPGDGAGTVLRPGDVGILEFGSEICLLPGRHRFTLEQHREPCAQPEPKRQRSNDGEARRGLTSSVTGAAVPGSGAGATGGDTSSAEPTATDASRTTALLPLPQPAQPLPSSALVVARSRPSSAVQSGAW